MDNGTLTLTTSSLFLSSLRAFAADAPQILPPKSVELLACCSPLPNLPSSLPVSKLIPNTRFIVDGFCAAGDFSVSYFLSHFHPEHFSGLNPNWCRGIIFCSETTAALLVKILNVSSLFVYPLPLNKIVTIDKTNVILLDANHCPGAVQFLFEVGLERYIHTGDFRFHDSMKLDPFLQKFVGAETIFLDAAYCNPKCVFPSQEESMEYIVRTVQRTKEESQGSSKPVLFLIAAYIVGKERILLEIAQKCNCLLHVGGRKMRILSVLGFGDSGVFTEDASASDVHIIGCNLLGEVWPYFRPDFVKMNEIMVEKGYSKAVGFVLTGWMYEAKKDGFSVRSKGPLEIHLVPYSEHSSYSELREFVRHLRPKRVVPTVGFDAEELGEKHAVTMQKYFRGLVDETSNKHEVLIPFHQKAVSPNSMSENFLDVENIEEAKTPSEKQRCTFGVMKEGSMQDSLEELRCCLPSWVNVDQLLSLLRSTDGDVVRAVSEFFEVETEYYNNSKFSILPNPHTQRSSHNVFIPTPALEYSKERLCLDVYNSSQDKNIAIKKLDIGSSSATKRNASIYGSKTRKKGKGSRISGSSGPKQPTITKFFGKSAPQSIDDGDQMINKVKLPIVDTVEPYKHEVDRFLQVINFTMDKNAANVLMVKAKGNIDAAVNMYYSSCDRVLFKEET